jgi:anti-anti-sigma factor
LIFRYPDPAQSRSGVPVLYVEVLDEGRDVTVDVRGDVDIATFELLRAAIQYGLDKQPNHMSVRLSEVSFFGAAGLRTLMAAWKQANEQAVELMLASPSRQVLTVLKLAGVKEHFKIEDGSSARMSPPTGGAAQRRPGMTPDRETGQVPPPATCRSA